MKLLKNWIDPDGMHFLRNLIQDLNHLWNDPKNPNKNLKN